MPLAPILTLGPATSSAELITGLLDAAAAFRLNSSHLSAEELEGWLGRLERVFAARGAEIPVYVDLQGAKLRIGDFPAQDSLPQRVRLVREPSGAGETIPVPHEAFFAAVQAGDVVTLNDARVWLRLLEVSAGECTADVVRNGPLSSHKGLNRRVRPLPCPGLGEADRRAVEVALGHGFTRFAFSFVHDGTEAQLLRPLTRNRLVAAKIEFPEAMPHLDRIAQGFDELWLCRGDLGAQAGLAELGPLQEEFGRRIPALGKPCYLAGQVLEYMTHFPQPTRAEVVALHQAGRDGFTGIVLSDETAVGRNPLEVARFLRELREATATV